jgi:hypothetical protein
MKPEAARRQLEGREATQAEIAFLVDGQGARLAQAHTVPQGPHRVELNAMSSGQIIALIEQGFAEHGVAKVMPNLAALADAYAGVKREQEARPVVERYLARVARRPVVAPADLRQRLDERLGEHPLESWEEALRAIVIEYE